MPQRRRASIMDHFQELEDPRLDRQKQHHLLDIIVIAISCVSKRPRDRSLTVAARLRHYAHLENRVTTSLSRVGNVDLQKSPWIGGPPLATIQRTIGVAPQSEPEGAFDSPIN